MVIKPAKISPKNRQLSPMLGIYGQREPHLNCDPSASAPPGTDTVRAAARSVRGGRVRMRLGRSNREPAPCDGNVCDGQGGAWRRTGSGSQGWTEWGCAFGRPPVSRTLSGSCIEPWTPAVRLSLLYVSTWVRDKGSPMCKLVSSVSGQACLPSVQRAAIFLDSVVQTRSWFNAWKGHNGTEGWLTWS